jgi:ATP-dependent helicase HrpA
MAELGLGTIDSASAPADTTQGGRAGSGGRSFPFIDPPDARAVRDAVALLVELGALTPQRPTLTLTTDGRRMARLPVDPRFGRMLLAAETNGCLREVTVIVAALSIQDPRERPTGEEQAADEMHARFAVPGSDFLAYLNLWEHLAAEQRARSGSGFRRMCRAEHLNHVRVREWQDLVRQLREVAQELHLRRNDRPVEPDAIHRSLLAGLLSHVGMWDRATREYRGARQARFLVGRRSGLTRSSPTWVMAGELVETGRLWAGMVARIDPSWIEPLAGHLVKRHYGEPRWSRRRGMALTDEQVTLYGLPIVPGRPVPLERIDPPEARAMFIDHALVDGDWDDDGRYTFVEANRQMLDKARGLEARARRSDLVVGEERLADLYDERLPTDVVSSRHFQRWWKDAARRDPDTLSFTLEDLLGLDTAAIDTVGFPLTWTQDDLVLDLSYVFEPGADDDGVTVHVPLLLLPRVSSAGVDWHVPGHRLELVTALIRTLPKPLRRELVPAPERAKEALDGIAPDDGPLLEVLARRLGLAPTDFDLTRLPRHLQLRFSIEDDDGTVVASGRDLEALSSELAERARQAVAAATPGHLEQSGLLAWPDGGLPRMVDGVRGAVAYPTLIDEGESVGVRIVTSPSDQERLMWAATRRLLLLAVPRAQSQAERRLRAKRVLTDVNDLAADCVTAAADRLLAARGGPAWDEDGYRRLEEAARDRLAPLTIAAATLAAEIVLAASALTDRLGNAAPALEPAIADMRSQLSRLVFPGFVAASGLTRLQNLARYIEAARLRLDKLRERPDRDRNLMARARALEAAYDDLLASLPPSKRADASVVEARWMLEELRVSLFAQTLGTAHPVSEQRVTRALASLV